LEIVSTIAVDRSRARIVVGDFVMYRISMRLLVSLFGVLAISGAGLGAVLINEVELNPPGDAVEWVELYNSGAEMVDISGWRVEIVDSDPTWTGSIRIFPGNAILAGGFYVAEGDTNWLHDTGRGIVILKTRDGIEMDKTHLLIDQSDNIFTNSRFPNGVDTDQRSDWVFGKGTKNAVNS
jgi:hypothetical protein